jgi:hypothetical protein
MEINNSSFHKKGSNLLLYYQYNKEIIIINDILIDSELGFEFRL